MKIEIIKEYEHYSKPKTNVHIIVDGKKHNWTMANGLWDFVKKLIKNQK